MEHIYYGGYLIDYRLRYQGHTRLAAVYGFAVLG